MPPQINFPLTGSRNTCIHSSHSNTQEIVMEEKLEWKESLIVTPADEKHFNFWVFKKSNTLVCL